MGTEKGKCADRLQSVLMQIAIEMDKLVYDRDIEVLQDLYKQEDALTKELRKCLGK